MIAVALERDVYLFDPVSGQSFHLLSLSAGNVTSLRWTAEGGHVGVGTSLGELQIWDGREQRQLRSLRGHSGRIGAVAWHLHTLSSGAADAEIHHHV
jgi:cell division cycle protein 20 (cofactor of APC complex)